MAHFIATIQGRHGVASRLGHNLIRCTAEGWTGGVRVTGEISKDGGEDVFYVWVSRGSKDMTPRDPVMTVWAPHGGGEVHIKHS